MESNIQETFKLNATIAGKMRKGTEFPQSPGHADPTGTLDTDISFEGVVIKNTENVVFRITKVSDRGNMQIEHIRERGMQEIAVGQILSVEELTGWDIQPV